MSANRMRASVSRCCYHMEKGAAGTCVQCGVGLCSECIVWGHPKGILCRQCAAKFENKQHAEKYGEKTAALRKQGGRFRTGKAFLILGIVSLLLVAALNVVIAASERQGLLQMFQGSDGTVETGIFRLFVADSILFCLFCSIICGWIAWNDRFPNKSEWTFSGKLYMCIKIMFCAWGALLTGWIIFIFYCIRFVITSIKKKPDTRKRPMVEFSDFAQQNIQKKPDTKNKSETDFSESAQQNFLDKNFR